MIPFIPISNTHLSRFLLYLILLLSSCSIAKAEWRIWNDLKELANVDAPYQSLLRSSYCPYNCRFDRTSSGDTRFYRQEGNESVIFEELNPGVITRIWMTSGASGMSLPLDPSVRIKFYFDDEPIARIDVPLPDLFNGSTPPFHYPLAGDRLISSGGNFSFVPIPYSKKLKVTLTDAEDYKLWFQFNFQRWPVNTSVESFQGNEDLSAFIDLLNQSGSTLWRAVDEQFSGIINLSPGIETEMIEFNHGGWLKSLTIESDRQYWDQIQIQLIFDGIESEFIPLNLFFAVGEAEHSNTLSLFLGEDENNKLYSYFPMPFHESLAVRLKLDIGQPSPVAINFAVGLDSDLPLSSHGYFSLQHYQTCPSVALEDSPFLVENGQGKWVGLFAEYSSVESLSRSYLEGDERIYLDGDIHPTLYGTGTEDIFSAGFYFDQGNLALPLHGSPYFITDNINNSLTSAYRFMILDSIAFQSNINAVLENGPYGDLLMCHNTVAYYYKKNNSGFETVDELSLSDPFIKRDKFYKTSELATSDSLTATFLDQPPTELEQSVNRYEWGATSFVLTNPQGHKKLKIKRLLDNHYPGQAADVYINGKKVGAFNSVPEKPEAYIPSEPDRRWVEQSISLPGKLNGNLHFTIVPRFDFNIKPGSVFTESNYQLSGEKARRYDVDTYSDDESLNACSQKDDDCSLRGAISKASSSDVVNIALDGDFVISKGPILIDKDIAVIGAGRDKTNLIMNSAGRHFIIVNDAEMALSDLSLSGSAISSNHGGVLVSSGDLRLNSVTVSGNRANEGGGLQINSGQAQLNQVIFADNTADLQGASILNRNSHLTLHQVEIKDHTIIDSASIIANLDGEMEILKSSIYFNQVSEGSLIKNMDAILRISNSILSDNTSNTTSLLNSIGLNSMVLIKNSTVFNNQYDQTLISNSNSSLMTTHSVFSKNWNLNTDNYNDCPSGEEGFTSQGYNLFSTVLGCDDSLIDNDLYFLFPETINPGLSELDMSTFPAAIRPLATSVLIDAGEESGTAYSSYCLPTDQQSFSRSIDGNGDSVFRCDIGALEFIDLIFNQDFD